MIQSKKATNRDRFNPSLSDEELTDLALQTRNWARHLGAYLNPTGSDHGYFTVAEWCERFEHSRRAWKQVKRRLLQMGEPLAQDDFGGHYWGKQGDQARSLANLLKQANSRNQTVALQFRALIGSEDWPAIRTQLETEVLKGRQLDLRAVPEMLRASGADMPDGFEQLLLAMPTGDAA